MGVLLATLPTLLDKVLGAVLPDPQARADAIAKILGLVAQLDLGQMNVNAEEAKNPSVFVAGWRPFIGWVCGFAILYSYFVSPLASWSFAALGWNVPELPALDDHLWEVLTGMLGLGAMRTVEKVKNLTR